VSRTRAGLESQALYLSFQTRPVSPHIQTRSWPESQQPRLDEVLRPDDRGEVKTRPPLPPYAREIIDAIVRHYGDLPDDVRPTERQWRNVIFVLVFAAARLIQETADPAATCQTFIGYLQTAMEANPNRQRGS
jgi:hypothetical protein